MLLAAALTLAAIECWPLPGRARDVLPTEGHRWLASQASPVRALDCTPRSIADVNLPWLMQQDIRPLQPPGIESCDDPGLVGILAAAGISHVIVRAALPAPWPGDAVPDGLRLAASFATARVYRVAAPAPPLVVVGMLGFHPWEGKGPDRTRWMKQTGSWTIMNTTDHDQTVFLDLDAGAFAGPRHLAVALDGRPVAEVLVDDGARGYRIGPMALSPGTHQLEFRSLEPAVRPADVSQSRDRRPLAIRILRWSWLPAGR